MDIIEVLNTIRDNATQTYQDRIPEASRDNMEQLRAAMIDDDNVMVANEFMFTLLNKLIKQTVHKKRFENPLKSLKKGKKPLGDTIEEIYNNFLKGEKHNADSGADLMKRSLPDTKTVYHRMNFQHQYPVTVDRARLSKAFTSVENLENYILDIIDTLYNSAELDEFANTKELLASALRNNALKTVEIPDPLVADPAQAEANGKAFIKSVKTVSRLMTFPNADFNAYLTAQNTDDKPITTLSRKSEQVLIVDAATDTGVAVDVLASAFNKSVVEFNDTQKIVIDAFPIKNARAALVDEAFFQIYDDLYTLTQWFNPKSIYTNYYLNVWQTFAYSILVNAVLFVVPEEAAAG